MPYGPVAWKRGDREKGGARRVKPGLPRGGRLAMARAWRGKHWGHAQGGTGGTCRKERPNPSRAVGNCPDGRRILHIVAQMAPEARNRAGPGQDAEPQANAPCKAARTQNRHAREGCPPGVAEYHDEQTFSASPDRRMAAGTGHTRPCDTPAITPRESARLVRKVETPQPRGTRPKPARHVRSGGRACSGSMNMIMMRAWATVIQARPVRLPPPRGGRQRKGRKRLRKPVPVPSMPAAGLHTGPVHRPC